LSAFFTAYITGGKYYGNNYWKCIYMFHGRRLKVKGY
jgi:hypothetical protein